ncbi:MAG: hypothetical protein E7469_08710 [Ruminococcaceae bacterium]|nr:hypothetical protein [Oscillospiraceae bacterium]
MEKYYRFAGVELSVSAPDEIMYEEDRHLAPFRTDCVTKPHRFTFQRVAELSAPEGKLLASEGALAVYEGVRYVNAIGGEWKSATLRAGHCGYDHAVEVKESVYPTGITAKTVLNAIMAEHLVLEQGGVVFHCSYIAHQGRAILFTAPSGTGKSTQAELWRKHRGAEIINGDRAAIRVTEDGVMACGIPFAGSSEYCRNETLSLAAIVYLAQAPQTTIRPLRGYESFRCIWEGCSVNTWDKADISRAADLVQRIVEEIPVYYLPCTPDESAVQALENMLESR